jgi:hypothetical protein
MQKVMSEPKEKGKTPSSKFLPIGYEYRRILFYRNDRPVSTGIEGRLDTPIRKTTNLDER